MRAVSPRLFLNGGLWNTLGVPAVSLIVRRVVRNEATDMISRAEVVVIGGGCNGASIAYHLAKRGVTNVALLEKSFLAFGGTGKSSAIVRQHYSNEETAKMALESLRVFQNFEREVGGASGFTQTGFLVLVGPKDLDGLKTNVAMQWDLGIETRVISVQELNELEPEIRTADLAAAAYEPQSGYADPVSTTDSFAKQAESMGAKVLVKTEVVGIRTENGKVQSVVTNRGKIDADVVVNATGVWGARIAEMAGVEVPLIPTRHPVCYMRCPEGFREMNRVVVDYPNAMYLKPEGIPGRKFQVGSIESNVTGLEIDPDNYGDGIDFETITRYAGRVTARYPRMEMGVTMGGFSGPYDITPDWHPILDKTCVEGFYLAVGFSGHGFKLCPAVGRLMAELITEGKTSCVNIRFFRSSRFEEGKPIRGRYEYSIVG